MNRVIKILLLLSLVFIFSTFTFGQLVSDAYCKEFENAVAAPLNPVHWYSNIVFKDDCRFEFDIDFKGGTGILFDLERYETEKAAHKELRSDIEMYKYSVFKVTKKGETIFEKSKPVKLNKNNFGDEAFAYENNHPILLRKKRTYITVFCDKAELCTQIEKKLREVSILREF